MTAGRARGKQAALALFDRLELGEEPVDVLALAGRLGARVMRGGLEGAQARMIGDGRYAIIRVSDQLTHAGAQRFSIAHELGHLVLAHGRVRLADLCAGGALHRARGSAIEAEANAFAAELLMPERIVEPEISRAEPSFALAAAIAAARFVSLIAAAVRVVELCRVRCALVYAEDGRVVWSVASSTFGVRIARGRPLDHESIAARCPDEIESGTIPARLWLDHGASEGVTVMEEAMRVPASGAVIALVRIVEHAVVAA